MTPDEAVAQIQKLKADLATAQVRVAELEKKVAADQQQWAAVEAALASSPSPSPA